MRWTQLQGLRSGRVRRCLGASVRDVNRHDARVLVDRSDVLRQTDEERHVLRRRRRQTYTQTHAQSESSTVTEQCRRTTFHGGLNLLHEADDDAVITARIYSDCSVREINNLASKSPHPKTASRSVYPFSRAQGCN